MRPETGFLFIVPLVALLQSAAASVLGAAISGAAWAGVSAALTPRSEDEQHDAVAGITNATQAYISKQRWISNVSTLEHQLDQGVFTNERAFEARGLLQRAYAFVGRNDVSDVEREAAFHTLRIRFGELVAAETRATQPGSKKKPAQPPSTIGPGLAAGSTAPAAPVPKVSAAGGGLSSAGTFLLLGGAALLLWAVTR